jgi:hypothetical protein
MHHGEIAIQLAEMLDRAGFLILGQLPSSVTAQVRVVGKDSSVIRLIVGSTTILRDEMARICGEGENRGKHRQDH